MKQKVLDIKSPKSENPEIDPKEEELLQILKEKTLLKAKKKADKEKHYVDTKALEKRIKTFYHTNKIDDLLAIDLYNIAFRISFMPNFINYSWKEEMIGDGLIKEFIALRGKKFNPKRGKAFSYFSMIVYNAFRNRIKNEIKKSDVLKDYQAEQYDNILFNQNQRVTTNNEEASDD